MMPGMASSIPPAVSEFPPGVRNERRGEEEEEEEEEEGKMASEKKKWPKKKNDEAEERREKREEKRPEGPITPEPINDRPGKTKKSVAFV